MIILALTEGAFAFDAFAACKPIGVFHHLQALTRLCARPNGLEKGDVVLNQKAHAC